MSIRERIDALAERGWLGESAARRLQNEAVLLSRDVADKMIENVIGVFALPLAVAPNFTVNGRNYLVPMAVEEPSIVAGVSGAARLARAGGGFTGQAAESLLIGQIQLTDVRDPDAAMRSLNDARGELLALANRLQPGLLARGGGARDIECFKYRLPGGRWTVVLHLLVDTCDAMGANAVNSMCEGLAGEAGKIASARAGLRILSNLADRAIVTAAVTIPQRLLTAAGFAGEQVRDRIVAATDLANANRYRAATHNKGIMNGIDAVAVATGNDWRSLEAAAHAYACRDGAYRSLSSWSVDPDGNLAGTLSMPIKVGIVGGSLRANPAVALCLEIAGVSSAAELARLMGAVGLAQNLAALRALVTEGIQKGHMGLHARSVAASIGTPPRYFDRVVAGLVGSGEVKAGKAHRLLEGMLSGEAAAERAMDTAAVDGVASGKVILFGEHAAVYDRHALALPIEDAVTATVRECAEESRLLFRDIGVDRSAKLETIAVDLLHFITERLNVADRHFEVRVQTRIPPAMGLGASAAVAVAMLRGFNSVLEKGLDDAAINALSFECEKLAHGNPSGIDNTLATYGQAILFRKDASRSVDVIELEEPPPLVIAASGVRGGTKEQVAAVARRYEKNIYLYNAIFDEMDEIGVAGAAALSSREYDTLGSLMNICHGLLNALEVSTPELETMVAIARTAGAVGAKLTGAGGGGSIVALCPGKVAAVERALIDAGYRIVRMHVS